MTIRLFLNVTACLPAVCLVAVATVSLADADEWTSVPCAPVDQAPEKAFEVVEMVEDFREGLGRWAPIIGEQNAACTLHHDLAQQINTAGALRIDYDFVGKTGLEYLQVRMPRELDQSGLGLGFWVKQGDVDFPIRVRIADRSGETHQFDLISRPGQQWQFVVGMLDGPSSSWGGDENGRCDYPCRLEGILFDRPARGYVGRGSLWIDDVALVRPRPSDGDIRVSMQNVRFGNLFAVGESVELKLAGDGDQVRWTWEDYWGDRFAEGEGKADGITAQFMFPRPGYFRCRIELLRSGQVTREQQFCCAALMDGKESGRSDFVGVCSHYGQNNYPLPSMDLMQAYGIDQFRDEISWRSYERQRGEYALPSHASSFLQRAAQLQMRPLIIYDYSNPLYDNDGFPNSPEAIAAFAAYAANLTRDTRGIVGMFEIWNEWIGGCGMQGRPGDHGPEAYGRLQQATYQAVKEAFPEVTVVGIGGEYGEHCAENVVTALRTAGPDTMDGWSIHPYRYPRSPEESDLAGEVSEIARQVRDSGVEQKAWITEIGWPTHRTTRGSTETMQARYCVRTLALLQSTGLVEKVFWYDFKDDGTRRDYNEHNFGLVRHQSYNCAPKPAVVAMSVFVRMTGEAKFEELLMANACYMAVYRSDDGRKVAMAWSSQKPRKISVSGNAEQIVDIMGADVDPANVVELTGDPIYVVGDEVTIEVE